MPMYEGLGLISEKHAVVLDIGSGYTKCGYAGEAHPRVIVKTPSILFQYPILPRDELYDAFVTFVHSLYFEHLLVSPKDRRVVLIESIVGNSLYKDILAQVLFRHFEVLSILFSSSHLMPMFLLGIRTGLVLDVGHQEAILLPVYEGVPILKAWQALPLAGKAVQESVRTALEEDGVTDEEIIEDIAVRFCSVAKLDRGKELQKLMDKKEPISSSLQNIFYPLNGNEIIHVKGGLRERVCEIMFEMDLDSQSIPSMILDALMACSIDSRKELAKNLIFVGGGASFPGFRSRVVREVQRLLKTHSKYSNLRLTEFKIHNPPGALNSVCWTGASLFGATDAISTRSYMRDQYLKNDSLPDWCNLKFNLQNIEDMR